MRLFDRKYHQVWIVNKLKIISHAKVLIIIDQHMYMYIILLDSKNCSIPHNEMVIYFCRKLSLYVINKIWFVWIEWQSGSQVRITNQKLPYSIVLVAMLQWWTWPILPQSLAANLAIWLTVTVITLRLCVVCFEAVHLKIIEFSSNVSNWCVVLEII